jgi:hypothetical protein
MGSSTTGPRAELASRLRARRSEIEEAILARIHAIADPSEAKDPAYVEGLKGALADAVDYGLAGIEYGDERQLPVPVALLAQARLAGRNSVSIEIVLRRYCAGYVLLADYLLGEAEDGDLLGDESLKSLMRTMAGLFDQLLRAVSEEHRREAGNRSRMNERCVRRVERLLDGEPLDTMGLEYDFEHFHVAAVAMGGDDSEAIAALARDLDTSLLLVQPAEGITWFWLGSRRRIDPAEAKRKAEPLWTRGSLAIGECAGGLAGWRLSHSQAKAALRVAGRVPEPVVRYAGVALLATALQDEVLATSLRQIYLAPLERQRGGGAAARTTLRAYFAAERQISSAAAALGLDRNTVSRRLRQVERLIGSPLARCAAELETALRLEKLRTGSSQRFAESELESDADRGTAAGDEWKRVKSRSAR